MKRIKEWLEAHPHTGHFLHECLHLTYFGMVFIESHGFYGYAAGALAVLGLLSVVKGGEA